MSQLGLCHAGAAQGAGADGDKIMNQILRIQQMLLILGFFIPEEEVRDGKFGDGSHEAVRKFQEQFQQRGCPVDHHSL